MGFDNKRLHLLQWTQVQQNPYPTKLRQFDAPFSGNRVKTRENRKYILHAGV